MDQKKSKNSSPRIKVIQKLYNALMNPDALIDYPKSQYKKFIKDVVTGTLERSDLIENQIKSYLAKDIDLTKTDKLLKIILFAAIFELMFKHNTPKKVIKITLTKGIGGIFFSKNQTTANATKVAIISGGIATDKFLPLL